MAVKKAKSWGAKHRRWASMVIGRAADETFAAGDVKRAESILSAVLWSIGSEAHLRDGLVEARYDHARVEATVKLVRDLAEGRKVREPPVVEVRVVWPDKSYQGPFESVAVAGDFISAIDPANGLPKPEARRVRVARTRRVR